MKDPLNKRPPQSPSRGRSWKRFSSTPSALRARPTCLRGTVGWRGVENSPRFDLTYRRPSVHLSLYFASAGSRRSVACDYSNAEVKDPLNPPLGGGAGSVFHPPPPRFALVPPVSGGQSVTTANTAPADRPTSQWKLLPSEGTEAHQCFF